MIPDVCLKLLILRRLSQLSDICGGYLMVISSFSLTFWQLSEVPDGYLNFLMFVAVIWWLSQVSEVFDVLLILVSNFWGSFRLSEWLSEVAFMKLYPKSNFLSFCCLSQLSDGYLSEVNLGYLSGYLRFPLWRLFNFLMFLAVIWSS